MSLADGLVQEPEERDGGRSRSLGWLLRIAGFAILGGAIWIILWIDNRPSQASSFSNRCCDGTQCTCSRFAHEKPANQRQRTGAEAVDRIDR